MRRALLAAVVLAAAAAAPAQAAPRLVPIDGSYDAPLYLTAPPRDATRLFVVEQGGLVKVVHNDAAVAQPFIDLTGRVALSHSERGLLGLAFPPDYETSGLVYTYLTAAPDGELQIREHRRSTSDPNRTEPGSRIVWRHSHDEAGNHNGGTIQFGPDGMLWLAPGDGGGGDDQFGHAQDLNSQLGKVLRIDPRPSAGRGYTVPAGNPYSGAAETVWAAGLRNPYRFSFDRSTGDLVIGDVGQSTREEIDWVRWDESLGRGGNFGWPCFEGEAAGPRRCTPPGYIPPVHDYAQGNPRAVAGGVVVRDPDVPTLFGRYVYADTFGGDVRSLVLGRPATGDRSEGLPQRNGIAAFGEDACGHVYVVSLAGTVERIEDRPPVSCAMKPDPRPLPPVVGAPAPTPPGASADTRRPSLRVRIRGRRSLARRARLLVSLRSDEDVRATLTGRLNGVARFRTARVRLSARSGRVVRLRLRRAAARKLRSALTRKRVVARLSVTVRDAAGNRRRAGRRVVVPRRR